LCEELGTAQLVVREAQDKSRLFDYFISFISGVRKGYEKQSACHPLCFRHGRHPHGIGARFAHALKRRSRCVMIAGHGHRARSADRGGWSVAAAARPRRARVGALRTGEAMSVPPRLQDPTLCVPKLAFI
jgi:hypothetical protein